MPHFDLLKLMGRLRPTGSSHVQETPTAHVNEKQDNETPNLASLPFDILLHILRFLPPIDIITIEKTCQALQTATTNRFVWRNALRRVLFEKGVPECGYDLHEMPIKTLQYCALSPHKFVTKLEACAKSGDGVLQCTFARQLFNRLPKKQRAALHIGTEPPGTFTRMVPLYGGRYLVTTAPTENGKQLLQVWDLGLGGRAEINLIALTVNDDEWFTVAAIPMKDGKGLYAIISDFQSSPRIFKSFRLLLDQATSPGKVSILEEWGKTAIPNFVSQSYHNEEKKFVLINHENIFLWEVESNKTWAWRAIGPSWNFPQYLPMIHAYPEAIMIAGRDTFLMFNMPTLDHESEYHPNKSLPTISCVKIIPSLCPPRGSQSEFVSGFALARNSGPLFPELFGMFNRENFYSYHMLLTNDGDPETTPFRTPTLKNTYTDLPWMDAYDGVDFGPMQYIDGRTFIAWIDETHDHFRVTRFPMDHEPPNSSVTIEIRKPSIAKHGINTFFYAATGRVCSLTWAGTIHILDYLEPPPE